MLRVRPTLGGEGRASEAIRTSAPADFSAVRRRCSSYACGAACAAVASLVQKSPHRSAGTRDQRATHTTHTMLTLLTMPTALLPVDYGCTGPQPLLCILYILQRIHLPLQSRHTLRILAPPLCTAQRDYPSTAVYLRCGMLIPLQYTTICHHYMYCNVTRCGAFFCSLYLACHFSDSLAANSRASRCVRMLLSAPSSLAWKVAALR